MKENPYSFTPPAMKENPYPFTPQALTWRQNFARMADEIAASPLPTRQLKRMAARQLARALATRQKLEARRGRYLAQRRAKRKPA